MTYEGNAKKLGRIPFAVLELKLSKCQHVYADGANGGAGNCTANEASGGECYNTRNTCQDSENFLEGKTSVYFCTKTAAKPSELDYFPCLDSAKTAPTSITGGRGIGNRASITVKLTDFKHHDRGLDPYQQTRIYDTSQGSFFTKLLARNRYYQSREMVYYEGFLVPGEPFDLSSFKSFHYIIDSISNPSSADRVVIKGKDILKKIDDRRALFPAPSTGTLAANVNNSQTNFTLATDEGVNYPIGAYFTVGSEMCLVTGTPASDQITVSRAQVNTDAQSHSSGDLCQISEYVNNENVVDIIYRVCTEAAGIPADYIDLVEWHQERDTWVPNHNFEAWVAKPTGATKIIDELTTVAIMDIWQDPEERLIKLKSTSPFNAELVPISIENIVKGSLKIRDLPSERLSRVFLRYDQQDPTKSLTEDTNYNGIYGIVGADLESPELYGEIRALTTFTRWLRGTVQDRDNAFAYGQRIENRYSNNPKEVVWQLDVSGGGAPRLPKAGEVTLITVPNLTDVTGQPIAKLTQILQRGQQVGGRVPYKGKIYDEGDNNNTICIESNQFNYNLWAAIGAPPSAITVNLCIKPGVKVCSLFNDVAALRVGPFAPGSIINIENEGFIIGKGGDAGDSGGLKIEYPAGEPAPCGDPFFRQDPTSGENASNALELAAGVTVNIKNVDGIIGGGSGGNAGKYGRVSFADDAPTEPELNVDGADGGAGCTPGVKGEKVGTGSAAGSDGVDGSADPSQLGQAGAPTNYFIDNGTEQDSCDLFGTAAGGSAGKAIDRKGATVVFESGGSAGVDIFGEDS